MYFAWKWLFYPFLFSFFRPLSPGEDAFPLSPGGSFFCFISRRAILPSPPPVLDALALHAQSSPFPFLFIKLHVVKKNHELVEAGRPEKFIFPHYTSPYIVKRFVFS